MSVESHSFSNMDKGEQHLADQVLSTPMAGAVVTAKQKEHGHVLLHRLNRLRQWMLGSA
jgi:hypothetical protein